MSVAADNGTVKNHLPSLANTGAEMVVAWNEYDATATVPWESTTTSAHISTIRKGSSGLWSAKTELTAKTAGITVFPTLYVDHAGKWLVAYLGAYMNGEEMFRFAKDLPLATPTAMPRSLPLDGSKPHIVATATPDVFVAAWEDGAVGARDIVVRTYGVE